MVQLYGVDGRLLHGRIAEASLNHVPLRNVEYRFEPSCLLQLKLCYRFKYDRGRFQLAYDLVAGSNEISNAEIEYPVQEILSYVKTQLPVKPGGRVQLQVNELAMLDTQIATVTGTLLWRNLGVDDGDIQIDIGDYQVDFNGTAERYEFRFSDRDAALDVSGDAVISADGRFQTDVLLSSKSGSIDPQVRTVIDLVAKRNSANQYHIEHEGRVPPQIASQMFR